MGIDDYIKIASTTTSAFGNTISLYAKIFDSTFKLLADNPKAYYTRDEGEYSWQKKGSAKVVGQLLRTVGITGSSGDPTRALEGFENASKLK